MSRNRTKDAYNILQKIAKSNKKVLPELHETVLLNDSKKSAEANEKIVAPVLIKKLIFKNFNKTKFFKVRLLRFP